MTWHYFIGLFRIKTVDSAQPRNRSIVTRPFSSWEGGVWGRDYQILGGGNGLGTRLQCMHSLVPWSIQAAFNMQTVWERGVKNAITYCACVLRSWTNNLVAFLSGLY